MDNNAVENKEKLELNIKIETGKDDAKTDEGKESEKKEEIVDYGGSSRLNKEYGFSNYCFLYIACFIVSTISGAITPVFGVLFRNILDLLIYQENKSEAALKVMVWFILLGVGMCICNTSQYTIWGYYGSSVTVAVRKVYFRLLLVQEIGYHDEKNSAHLNAGLSGDCLAIEEGIGLKMGFAVQQIATFTVGFVVAFVYSWKMTLVLIGCVPVLITIGVIQGKVFQGNTQNADPFAKTSAYSQEVLSNFRTVAAFPDLAKSKIVGYKDVVNESVKDSIKKSLVMGLGMGVILFGMFGVMYSIGLYYGSVLVNQGKLKVGDMFGCFFCFIISGMALGQLGSVGNDINKAKDGANRFYALQDRKIQLKEAEKTPVIIEGSNIKFEGSIEFENVEFAYPVAPDTKVLKGLTFSVQPGKILAIVGSSGSGKSTVMTLLERYYDPTQGKILIDGKLIHEYDLTHLRSQIGLVSQMPLLFNESVEENIRAGRKNLTLDQIMEGAKKANAHEFIQKLPDGYNTKMGELGNRLSGGQRQRICIARALVDNPTILLLDEATSALDSASEKEVQETLDAIASEHHHTIIVIAHRLSTVKNADHIIVLLDGTIKERGTHDELMTLNGFYATSVKSQEIFETRKLKRAHSSSFVD